MTLPKIFILGAALLCCVPSAQAYDVWDDRGPLLPGNNLVSAAYGAGRFLAITSLSSQYHTSVTGVSDWATQSHPGGFTTNAIAFGDGKFVIVGAGGIYTSPTGLTGSWTARTSGVTRPILSVRYLNGQFVAGTARYDDENVNLSYTEILTSPDGITWTSHKYFANTSNLLAFAYNISDVAFKPGTEGPGSGVWVVGTGDKTNTCLYANENFSTLTRVAVLEAGGDQRVVYGGGMFVMVSRYVTGSVGKVWYSSTGTSWTQAALPGISVTDLTGVHYDGTRFVIGGSTVSGSEPPTPALLHSTDGINWTQAAEVPASNGAINFVLEVDGLWVAGGDIGTLFTSGESSANQPDIAVEQPVGTEIIDGGSKSFGDVSTDGLLTVEFTIKNHGPTDLHVTIFEIDGTDAGAFSLGETGSEVIGGDGSTVFEVKFTPTHLGSHEAQLRITSDDPNESPYHITLTGNGVAPVDVPTVTTAAATTVTHDGATLSGEVNAKGSPREVWFEYGATTALELRTAATPETVSSSNAETVTAALTGLTPHTRYYFRVRAAGALGGAQGEMLSFVTANRPPVGVDDDFAVVPGSTVVLDVLSNDAAADPDADALTILDFTQPSAGGTLSNIGGVLVFTAADNFSGATFQYTVGDAFEGTDTATVTVTQADCSLNPAEHAVSWAETTYAVAVTSSGQWSASETLSWASVAPVAGSGNGAVNVTLLANTAKKPRVGKIKIGNKEHVITQGGIPAPVLTMPTIPPAMVGASFSLPIPTENGPVRYSVAKLPPGLAIDHATGVIGGVPTTAGIYRTTVKATNAGGVSATTLTLTIEVRGLPDGTLGTFHGIVTRDADINGGLGSRIELTTTKNGTFSGKVITGTTAQAIKGRLSTDATLVDPEPPTAELTILRKGSTALTLNLTLNPSENTLAGTLSDTSAPSAGVAAWRKIWTPLQQASDYAGRHAFALKQNDTTAGLPQGHGYGAFTVVAKTGMLTAAGRLADGSTFTVGTFVGQDGQVLLYQALYSKKGSLAGSITLTPESEITDGVTTGPWLDWFKPGPAANSKDLVYRDGFSPLPLIATGGTYPALQKGAILLGADDAENNARLDFELDDLGFDLDITLYNPSSNGLTNKWTVPAHDNKVKLTSLNAVTGAFTGEFIIPGSSPALNRKTPFQGQIVRNAEDGISGWGYCLLSDLPTGSEPLAKAPKRSYQVRLRATSTR